MDPLHDPVYAMREGRDVSSRPGSADALGCLCPADGPPRRPPDAVRGIVFAVPLALLMWVVMIGTGVAMWQAVAAWIH